MIYIGLQFFLTLHKVVKLLISSSYVNIIYRNWSFSEIRENLLQRINSLLVYCYILAQPCAFHFFYFHLDFIVEYL